MAASSSYIGTLSTSTASAPSPSASYTSPSVLSIPHVPYYCLAELLNIPGAMSYQCPYFFTQIHPLSFNGLLQALHSSPPVVVASPALWPLPSSASFSSDTFHCEAKLCYSDDYLCCIFVYESPCYTHQPRSRSPVKLNVLEDGRVELFLWPEFKKKQEKSSSTGGSSASSSVEKEKTKDKIADKEEEAPFDYLCYEINGEYGYFCDFRCRFPKQFDYSWTSSSYSFVSSSTLSEINLDKWNSPINYSWKNAKMLAFITKKSDWGKVWKEESRTLEQIIQESQQNQQEEFRIKIGIYRGDPLRQNNLTKSEDDEKAMAVDSNGGKESENQAKDESEIQWFWQSAKDPLLPEVNFHVPQTFFPVHFQQKQPITGGFI